MKASKNYLISVLQGNFYAVGHGWSVCGLRATKLYKETQLFGLKMQKFAKYCGKVKHFFFRHASEGTKSGISYRLSINFSFLSRWQRHNVARSYLQQIC